MYVSKGQLEYDEKMLAIEIIKIISLLNFNFLKYNKRITLII